MTGKDVIAELVVELRASVQQAEQFEGEMRNLAAYARALAQALDCIRCAGGSRYFCCCCWLWRQMLTCIQILLSRICLFALHMLC